MNRMNPRRIARLLLFLFATSVIISLNESVCAQIVGAGPLRQLWRADLVNVDYYGGSQLKYEATSAILDSADNLFVGGSVRLSRPYDQQFPFIAKFDKNGMRRWEFWPSWNVLDLETVDAMASDGGQGVYAALRISTGGVQIVHLAAQAQYSEGERVTNCWINEGPRPAVNSVHLAADGQGGFYFLGLMRQNTNVSESEFTLIHQDPLGLNCWRTNLFRGLFWGGAGLERAMAVSSNSVYLCGLHRTSDPLQFDSQLARVGTNGVVHWVKSSRPDVPWNRLALLDDDTICVSGARNYEVWSANGDRLASHGSGGFCTVARQSPDASAFLVSDFNSANLVCVDRAGLITRLGQIPADPSTMGAVEMVNIAANRWLVAAKCGEGRGGFSSFTNNLSLFEFGQNAELKWRQRLPGFEYPTYTEVWPGLVQLWLLKASDLSIRLVVNLNASPGNPQQGIAVAAFSLTNEYAVPRLVSSSPLWTNIGPEGVQLSVQASGNGQLRYEWHHVGSISAEESTNASIQVYNPGVYCARLMDDNGESVTPAFNILRSGQTLSMGSWHGDFTLTFWPGAGVHFNLETSTNLLSWSADPTVYSSLYNLQTWTLNPGGENPRAQFFRARLLPRAP